MLSPTDIMAFARRPRILLVAAVISFTLVLAFRSYHHVPEHILWGPFLATDPWGKGVEGHFVENAHRLTSPDDFIPHFVAVTREKGMTMAEAKAGCTWGPDEKVNFQYYPNVDWVQNERSDRELAYRRSQWQHFVAKDMIPWEPYKDRFHGRGIVIVAGNKDTLLRTQTILKALLRHKSRLAVEIAYWANEMSEQSRQELAALYPRVFFNDLAASHNVLRTKDDPSYANFHLKTAALVNSRFAEPLLLDSDNIPLFDPEQLYASETYREYGTVFWPDIARSRPQNPAWAITNTACRMDEYEQESGQLLVDKSRFFYHLQLAAWLNDRHGVGVYYNEFLLGDKDMFRFAWHALKTPFGTPDKWLTSVGTVNGDFYCGHSFAQHHPDDGRVAFMHNGLWKTIAYPVIRWNRDERRGMFRSYKRAPSDEDARVSVDVGIKQDKYDYMPASMHPEDLRPAMCTDMYELDPRQLDEIAPGYEQFFDSVGGYWELDEYL